MKKLIIKGSGIHNYCVGEITDSKSMTELKKLDSVGKISFDNTLEIKKEKIQFNLLKQEHILQSGGVDVYSGYTTKAKIFIQEEDKEKSISNYIIFPKTNISLIDTISDKTKGFYICYQEDKKSVMTFDLSSIKEDEGVFVLLTDNADEMISNKRKYDDNNKFEIVSEVLFFENREIEDMLLNRGYLKEQNISNVDLKDELMEYLNCEEIEDYSIFKKNKIELETFTSGKKKNFERVRLLNKKAQVLY